MKEINGVDKQKKLVQIVLDEKEVSLLIKDIEELQFEDTKYKSREKFEYDRTSKIGEIIDLNLTRNGITDVSSKRIISALRAKYKSSNVIDDNERAEEI